jgi:outer membrane protein assembly factor BamB
VVIGDEVWMTTAVEKPPTPEQIEAQFQASGLDRKQFERREVSGSISLRALCVDRQDGRLTRDIELHFAESPEAIHIGNSYASPTPVVEPGRLYCHFQQATVCLDTRTGKILWKRHIPVAYSVGAGSSPVVYDDLLILICDGIDTQFVTALNKDTGETVWKTARPPFRTEEVQQRKAYSTPLIIRHEGRDQLIAPGAQWFISYDPRTGEEIWRVDHGDGFSNVPRPLFGHGMVYLCTGFGTKQLWAIRVDGQGDVTDTHVVWKERSQIPTNPTPLLAGELVFVISDTGVGSCLDARTGKSYWKQRIGGNHSASPICVSDRVYFFSQEGETKVIRAAADYEELAENHVAGRIMASPAVLPDALLLRTDTRLLRIE